MRRSSQVIAPLLASAAVSLLAGCKTYETKNCVDEQNHVVDPKYCNNLPNGQQPVAGTLSNNGGYYGNDGAFYPHYYRFYYGGNGGGFGSVVSGGSYTPIAGHNYATPGTTRGGFGSLFSGSSGGSAGEGHSAGGEGGAGE